MLDKGKISSLQLGVLMYPTVFAVGVLVLPASAAFYAKNDFWMTGIFTVVAGYAAVFAATRLYRLFPGMTIAQYSERIIGTWAGKAVTLLFSFHLLQITGIISRQYAEFVKGNFLFETPILIIISSMVLVAAIAVRGGVEMIARSAMIFTPIFILPMFSLLLLFPDLHIKNMFPVLGHGILPVLKGAAAPQAWVAQLFLITFFLPSLSDPQKGKKWALLSLIAIIFSMTFINLMTLWLLGADTGNKTYPVLAAVRYISIADFFENLEALILAMWIVGNFIKITVFYYAVVLSVGQCWKLSDYRPIVFPVGILVIACSIWGFPSFTSVGLHARIIAPFDVPVYQVVIPLLLLGIASLRRKFSGVKDGGPNS